MENPTPTPTGTGSSSDPKGGKQINMIQTAGTTLGVAVVFFALAKMSGKGGAGLLIIAALAGAAAGFFLDSHLQKSK